MHKGSSELFVRVNFVCDKHQEKRSMKKWKYFLDPQKVWILIKKVIVAHEEKQYFQGCQQKPDGENKISLVSVVLV